MTNVRIATMADLPRLVEIYNQAIATRRATADTIPFSPAERQGWFDAHPPQQHPIYVSVDATDRVTGYLTLSPYRGRPALERTAEISYYVDAACQGQGLGSLLMEKALADAPRLGKKVVIAILLEWNTPSKKLLEKFGFERWGYLPDVAELDGQVCGHLYYGLRLE